jgi:hypothetical protein
VASQRVIGYVVGQRRHEPAGRQPWPYGRTKTNAHLLPLITQVIWLVWSTTKVEDDTMHHF